jgi:hypothetical protein
MRDARESTRRPLASSAGCRDVPDRDAGFSLVEMTAALALTLALTAAIFSLTQSARAASTVQSEAADLQQRTLVAVDTIAHDIMMAGAGPYFGGHSGPLTGSLPPVLPFRRGMVGSDPAGTFKSDTIAVLYVPTTAAQTTLTADLGAGSVTMQVARVPVCAAGINLCSFSSGMTVLAFDSAGAFQIFTVDAVLDGVSQIITSVPSLARYRAGTAVVEVRVHSYSLKSDATTQSTQLIQYDGTGNADVPVLDHVVGLAFDYGIAPSELTDGPWRPDAASADRWDVDLLRIRTIGVTVRLEAALAGLRGPAGVLFANRGTATNPHVWLPDQEIRFHVSPRNLSLRR